MIPAAVLTIGPSGQVRGLYTEVIPLQSIGRLRVRRASHIEFDHGRQVWIAWDTNGSALFESPSRQECLEWEQRFFNEKEL